MYREERKEGEILKGNAWNFRPQEQGKMITFL
jgi:hypothetical protein